MITLCDTASVREWPPAEDGPLQYFEVVVGDTPIARCTQRKEADSVCYAFNRLATNASDEK